MKINAYEKIALVFYGFDPRHYHVSSKTGEFRPFFYLRDKSDVTALDLPNLVFYQEDGMALATWYDIKAHEHVTRPNDKPQAVDYSKRINYWYDKQGNIAKQESF